MIQKNLSVDLADEVNIKYSLSRNILSGLCNVIEENLLYGFDVKMYRFGSFKVDKGKVYFKPSLSLRNKIKEAYRNAD